MNFMNEFHEGMRVPNCNVAVLIPVTCWESGRQVDTRCPVKTLPFKWLSRYWRLEYLQGNIASIKLVIQYTSLGTSTDSLRIRPFSSSMCEGLVPRLVID